MISDSRTWTDCSEAFAFLGNSLLAPMSQTAHHGIDPSFWREFPDFGDAKVAKAIEACFDYADIGLSELGESSLVKKASIEYTHLFIGPPRPEAAPCETFYRNDGVTTGFGEAAFEMQRFLRDAGLQIANANNQYADHMGIELLYLSVLCERAAQGGEKEAKACASFAIAHPLSWIGKLEQRVAENSPEGYYNHLLQIAESLLGVVAR